MPELNSTFISTMRKQRAKQQGRAELYNAIAMGFILFLAFAALYLSIPIK